MAEEKKSAEVAASEEKKEVVVPEKFKSIVETVEQMSVLDLSELVSILEDKFGVSAAAPAAMMMAPGVAGGDAAGGDAEKSDYDVELTSAGATKIQVIKAVKDALGVGLKDAKDMVDGAPSVLKEKMPKAEAEELKKTLEEAGAEVTLK